MNKQMNKLKLSLAIALIGLSEVSVAGTTYGTYLNPFSASSPWNQKPVNPVLDNSYTIPTDLYYPSINQGAYSAGIFKAEKSDPAVKVYGLKNKDGVVQKITTPDLGTASESITIPHMPANVVPASGGDGHADIIDEDLGVVHSFWQLRFDATAGVWRTSLYSQAPLAGRGWPDGGRWYQGARAVGVPVTGGMIRKHEAQDGKPIFEHALSMSMSNKGLLGTGTGYVFPAGAADTNFKTNTGKIPEGALMMLPATYDTSKIVNKDLKKVAETLKVYGAYVVDRNYGTPYFIYVENGSTFDVHKKPDGKTGWNNDTANELQKMRSALKQVTSASGWVDGDGNITPVREQNLNLVSMRGPYYNATKFPAGVYNPYNGFLEFNTTAGNVTNQWNWSITPLFGANFINWAKPKVGDVFAIKATGVNGASAAVDCTLNTPDGKWQTLNMPLIQNGGSYTLQWTDKIRYCGVIAKSGSSGGYSAIKLEMKKLPVVTMPGIRQ